MSQIERWKANVGRTSEPVWNVVERGAVRRFAEAIGDPNPLYVDEEAARSSRYGGIIAPPTFARTFEYGEIEGMGWPEAGMLHGEHRIEHEGGPLRVGEELRCHTKLADYHEKEGRNGTLGFVVVERVGESLSGERRFTMQDVAIVTPAMRKALEDG